MREKFEKDQQQTEIKLMFENFQKLLNCNQPTENNQFTCTFYNKFSNNTDINMK